MYLTINDNQLFIDIYGSSLKIENMGIKNKPTMIVLHGGHGFADHTLYVEFWSQFQDIAQIIFVDQLGCGRSDPGHRESWNLQRWGSDVQEIIKTLGLEKPVLAGVSMGGHVIGECVRNFSHDIGGIILCNTEAKMNINGLIQQFEKHNLPDSARACAQFFNDPNTLTFSEYKKYCLPHYAKNAYSVEEIARCISNPEVFFHFIRDEARRFDYREDLKKICCPVLIMAGERGSHTLESANEMRDFIPLEQLTFSLFKDAGAPVYKDEPVQAEQAVRLFLNQIKLCC